MLWQKALLLIFLAVIAPLAIYGVYVHYRTATQIVPEIRQTLVEGVWGSMEQKTGLSR